MDVSPYSSGSQLFSAWSGGRCLFLIIVNYVIDDDGLCAIWNEVLHCIIT